MQPISAVVSNSALKRVPAPATRPPEVTLISVQEYEETLERETAAREQGVNWSMQPGEVYKYYARLSGRQMGQKAIETFARLELLENSQDPLIPRAMLTIMESPDSANVTQPYEGWLLHHIWVSDGVAPALQYGWMQAYAHQGFFARNNDEAVGSVDQVA